jgi:dihydrofolate synthase / folylpolyglutamate synthase
MSSDTIRFPDSAARYEAALRFLAGRIDYERAASMPNSEEAFKLDRMRELLRRLGNPHEGLPIVHVAGTKGKGSTSAMIAAVLSAAGCRTGLFTSPHLERVEERIMLDGRLCSADELADLVELVRPHVEDLDRGVGCQPAPQSSAAKAAPSEHGPTYFEILTAMALCHFAQNADAAVLEVGLGGRLDSTNVCTPGVSVITSISLDHTRQLGETLAAIATEKAGIIKPGVPVVSGVTAEEPRAVIRRVAAENGCPLAELGVDFGFEYHPPTHLEAAPSPARFDFIKPRPVVAPENTAPGATFVLGMLGRHQAANAAVALAALEAFRPAGWAIPETAIRRGLAGVVWPARIEVVSRRPTVILDAAHNPASIEALVEVLDERFSTPRRLLLFATSQDKDSRGMLRRLLNRFEHIIFTRYQENPRGVPAEQLSAAAAELSAAGNHLATAPPIAGDGHEARATSAIQTAQTPADAWGAIHRLARPDDLICITGSFFLAAEMRRQIAARPLGS